MGSLLHWVKGLMSDNFECSYCGNTFVREKNYLDHYCEQMRRSEEIKTPIGQAAWSYYQRWLKAYKKMPPSIQTFMKSRYYKSFVRFAKHVQKMGIPDVDLFIRLMKEKDIGPQLWTNDQVYSMYIERLDRKSSPLKQAEITINTLFKIADAAQVEVSQVFDVLKPNEVIQLVRQRQLSPWLLLFSQKFRSMLANEMDHQQRIVMDSLVRPAYWSEKFDQNPDMVKNMKKYVQELGI